MCLLRQDEALGSGPGGGCEGGKEAEHVVYSLRLVFEARCKMWWKCSRKEKTLEKEGARFVGTEIVNLFIRILLLALPSFR